MAKTMRTLLLVTFFGLTAYVLPAGAGDIAGTIGVAKPQRAVVFLQTVAGNFPAGRAQMDQRGKEFLPYVLPVLKGTTVEFRNGDDLQHNVFGIGAEEFNLGTFGKGGARDHTFNKLGEVTLLCNVHPEMEGHILVLQNPFFSKPGADGKFHIANVPAGDYVLEAWYADKTKKQNVKVAANGTVTVSF